MAQRLLICKECKTEYTPEHHEWPADFPMEPGMKLWKGAVTRLVTRLVTGAEWASTAMVTTDNIRELVVQRSNAMAIRNLALKEGMITLRQDGFRKVILGQTTLDEVARVTAGDIN